MARVTNVKRKVIQATALLTIILSCYGANVHGEEHGLDEMSLKRWSQLRETERYQLQIAETYYRDKDWKIAIGEYEKYLTLYESSEGASYAQLKWSLAHVHIRKANTAIKDGYQSVIDYWPDSPEAVAAAYYIGNTYKKIGQISKSQKAHRALLAEHPDDQAAVYAMVDLIEIANLQKDDKTRARLWQKMTFDVPRGRHTRHLCEDASRSLATWYLNQAAFNDALKALATTYPEDQLSAQIASFTASAVSTLVAQTESKAQGEALADRAIAHLRKTTPPQGPEEEAKLLGRQHWYLIANVQAASQRDTDVPKIYDEIINRYGPTDALFGRLAAWYKSKQKFDLARSVYRRYAKQIEGIAEIAASYRQERNPDSAIATYNQLLARDAENAMRWKGEIAATYRDIKKYPDAIGIYTELLSEDSENSEQWRWQIATAHRDAGQLKEAVGHFRQCTNFPENYKQMATCHRRLKQYNEALLLYNQIAGGQESQAPWALLQMGYTREEAGQKEAAIRAFQQVCKRFPRNGHASAAHAHLQNKYKLSITLGGAKDE